MRQLYYGMWKLLMALSLPIRVLAEILTVIFLIVIVWPIAKRIFVFMLKIVRLIHKKVCGGVRYIVCFFGQKSAKVFEWDEHIGEQGSKRDRWLQARVENLSKSKGRNIFKKKSIIIMLFIVYLAVILPSFRLERFLSGYYLEYIYFVSAKYMTMESKLSEGIEDYPDLFIQPEVTEVAAVEETREPIQETIYLVLREDIFYANVREEADMDSRSICTVSNEDRIAYQNIYKYDGNRYWLSVIVETQDAKEGWISGKVIGQETLDSLNLQ